MKKTMNVQEIALCGLFIALGITTPMFFHLFNMGGPMFLPMHIPVLIGGMVLSPSVAIILGVLTPLLSSILTGMPVLYPMGVIMMVELGVYALSTSLLEQSSITNRYVKLLIAMICGRIAAGVVVAILFFAFGFQTNPIAFVIGAVVTGLPGIIIQFVVVPPFQMALKAVSKRLVRA